MSIIELFIIKIAAGPGDTDERNKIVRYNIQDSIDMANSCFYQYYCHKRLIGFNYKDINL